MIEVTITRRVLFRSHNDAADFAIDMLKSDQGDIHMAIVEEETPSAYVVEDPTIVRSKEDVESFVQPERLVHGTVQWLRQK